MWRLFFPRSLSPRLPQAFVLVAACLVAACAGPANRAASDKGQGCIDGPGEVRDELDHRWTTSGLGELQYPEELRSSGIEGRVLFRTFVNAEGVPSHVDVLESPHSALSDAVTAAALRVRYQPVDQPRPAPASLLDFVYLTPEAAAPLGGPCDGWQSQTVKVEYPEELRHNGNRGRVDMSMRVDDDGVARDLVVLHSDHPGFERAVIKSISQGRKGLLDAEGKRVTGPLSQSFWFQVESWGPFSVKRTPVGVLPYGIPAHSAPEMPAQLQYDVPPVPRIVAPLVHPFELLRQGVDGSATVSVLIDPLGRVHETHIVQASEPAFGLALQASMQAWSFVPARQGEAPSWSLVTFKQSFGWRSRDGSTSESAVAILDRLEALYKAGARQPTTSVFVPVENLDTVPKPFYQPKPAYPASWAEKGLADSVVVEFFIDAEGVTQLPRIVSARHPELGWAAVTAVARWQFEPPMRQGQPVVTRARMTFEFKPPPEAKRG